MHYRRPFIAITLAAILIAVSATTASAAEPAKSPKIIAPYARGKDGTGFVSLFDGKTLKGWKAADMSWWSVEDGAITARITKEKPCSKNQYLFCEVGEMKDFELKLAHRILSPHKVNCGFQFRSEHYKDADCKGYQIDNNLPELIRLYDEFGRHTLAHRGERTVFDKNGKKTTTEIPEAKGEPWFDLTKWHEYHLICRGPKLTLLVNGRLLGEVIDNDPKNRDLSGLLALQLHSGPPMTVQFKDIRWKVLEAGGSDKNSGKLTPKQVVATFHRHLSDGEFSKAKSLLFMPIYNPRSASSVDEFLKQIAKQHGRDGKVHVFDNLIIDDLAVVIYGTEGSRYTDNIDIDPLFLRRKEGHWKLVLAYSASFMKEHELTNQKLKDVADRLFEWYDKRKPIVRAEWRKRNKDNK